MTPEIYAVLSFAGFFVVGALFTIGRQLDAAREQRAEILRELRRLKP
jgi:hypothetical protein